MWDISKDNRWREYNITMRIEIPLVNRANYGRLRALCILLSKSSLCELSISLLSSSILDKYGSIYNSSTTTYICK